LGGNGVYYKRIEYDMWKRLVPFKKGQAFFKGGCMRYRVKYVGYGIYAVVDTQAPESVCGDTSQGHLLLWCLNGSQPCQIAADALNAVEEKRMPTTP